MRLYRRIGLGLAGLLALAVPPAFAQQTVLPIPYAYVSQGFAQQTSFSTAVGLPTPSTLPSWAATGAAFLAGVHCAVITVDTNPVRYRSDGVSPTASVGIYLPVSTSAYAPFTICQQPGSNGGSNGTTQPLQGLGSVKFIPTTGNAVLNVEYY